MKICNCMLLFIALNCLNGFAKARFEIVEPYPQNIYPLEFTSAEVTCVAFDSEDPTVMPAELKFFRRNMWGEFTESKPDENTYFTNKTEENGRKLFVTMHIRNVTEEYDSVLSDLGRHECHARKVGGLPGEVRRHGFSISVVKLSEIPEVSVFPKYDSQTLERGNNVTLTCNVTQHRYGSSLKRISWLKDGKKMKKTCSVRFPDPTSPEDMLEALVLENISFRDEGTYTCFLEVLLRRITPHYVSDGTKITVGWKPEGCYKEHKLPRKRVLRNKYYTVKNVNKNAPDRVEQIFMKCKEQAEKNGYEIFGIRRNNICVTSTNGKLSYQKYGRSSDCDINQQGHGIGQAGENGIANFVYTR